MHHCPGAAAAGKLAAAASAAAVAAAVAAGPAAAEGSSIVRSLREGEGSKEQETKIKKHIITIMI